MINEWIKNWIEMIMGTLRKDFMRVATRTTLALLLPVGLVLSGCAYADNLFTKPAVSTRAEPRFEKIPFKHVTDLDSLVKSYPFLKELIESVKEDDSSSGGRAPTQVYIQKLSQKGKAPLFFLALRGPMQCGSGGCALMVYKDDGKGFKKVLDALAGDGAPVYVASDQQSLVTCGAKSRAEWLFDGKSFDNPVPYLRTQKLLPCN